jgi:hypothetical protein
MVKQLKNSLFNHMQKYSNCFTKLQLNKKLKNFKTRYFYSLLLSFLLLLRLYMLF